MARPRDPRIDERILQTTRKLLSQGSYADLTVAAITERAGVSKPALYRRWPSLTHLAFEVMMQDGARADLPDTGSIREDLFQLLRRLVDRYAAMDRDLLADQIAMMISDAEFSRKVYEATLDPMCERASICWQRAIDRNEVRSDIKGPPLMGDLAAQAFVRLAIRHDTVTDDDLRTLVDQFLTGGYTDETRRLSR